MFTRKKLSTALTVTMVLAILSCRALNESRQAGQQEERAGRARAAAQIKYDVPEEIDINYEVLDNIDISKSPYGVVPLPKELGRTLNGLFTKYTKHVAPNGKPIHIFAQSKVRDLQVARAREILKYHLTDAPGTKYGSHKAAIANRMADVRATLTYTDTQAHSSALRGILRGSELRTQDLYATESPVEGDYEYVHNEGRPGMRFSRDASYEEIMHLVHAKGLEDALPEFHEEIAEAEKRAVDAGIYRYGRPSPHEYIITGFDLYFGLWDHDPQGDGKSFGDEYDFHTRAEMKAGDRPLYDLVEAFWPKYLTYNAYIDPSFEGTFSTVLDRNTEYTFKSQHLVNITLTGDKDTNILGNDQDNRLTGNDGDNVITGGKGMDRINGGEGKDTAKFSGNSSEYRITKRRNRTVVTDSVSRRDGRDVLRGVEVLEFRDGSQQVVSEQAHVGGCILASPTGRVPRNLYRMTDVVQTDEYKPFTKKITVCGITLIGRDDISDEFMKKVARTIKSMFPRDGENIDADLQAELLRNMYKYRTVIPFYQGRSTDFSPEDEALWAATRSRNSVCDIIMEGVPTQTNEVIEHILHHVTDVGLHYTFPDEWGISTTSKAHEAVKDAIAKGYYKVEQYGDDAGEELNRVLIQEYAYWIIFAYWDLREPFFPRDAEFSEAKTPADLKSKLPLSYELVDQTIPRVMVAPSRAMLRELFPD